MNFSRECFLKQVANFLYQLHGQKITDLTFIFPNRRAGIFFTEYLNRTISGPTFAPEIITIQELFSNISKLRLEDQLQNIFRLFKIYKEISGSQETFNEFYLWGDMLLHDFDQVDKYLVDAELLFTNITDLKEIDEHFNDWNDERKEEIKNFWKSLNGEGQKHDQKEFARLWQVLFPIYQKLRNELFTRNLAYEGMLFRDAVENDAYLSSDYLSARTFIVVGFNALNQCEKRLFKSLQERGNISFYWDFDSYYLDDPNQEAGYFMRENLKLFPQDNLPYQTDLLNQPGNLQILHTSSQMGQAQLASKEITNLKSKIDDFDHAAIVLCDEELLLPVLSELPDEIDNVNVTMGLPLRQTPLFSLISLLIVLQRKNKREGEKRYFHFKNVIDILNNQLIQTLYYAECKIITDNIVRKNLLFVSENELGITPLFKKIFVCYDAVSDLPDYFLAILYDLFLFWEENKDKIPAINYQEYIFQVYLSVNKLNSILFTEGATIMGSKNFLTRETFFKLLLQHLGSMNVSLEGEPLSGLQVMGILETRSLDFENVILLSVNEGTMPKANTIGSFIPYHLRRGVGLPTFEEQNAIYAYYFYRLIQRANKVTFIYNSGSNGLRTGEKSRFLYQLLLESSFKITETGVENSIVPVPNYPIVIEKKGKVLEILNNFTDAGRIISPTALNLYLQCQLSFYFKYIARFEKEEDIAEEVDAQMFGKLYHSVMETLYQPFINKTVDENSILDLINDEMGIENLVREAFNLLFFKNEGGNDSPSLAGRNILVFEVIKKMVIQTLKIDQNRTPFFIAGLEQKIDATVGLFNKTKNIRIGGYIDRIDCISGATEIIDYKTGTTDHYFYSIDDLFDREAKKRNKAAFQTLVYAFIWDKRYPDSSDIYPCVLALKKIFKEETRRLTIKENGTREVNYSEIRNLFEPTLTNLLEEIFDPEVPFAQTGVEEHCQYCDFTSICGKQTAQS
jgi:hypothetical protein